MHYRERAKSMRTSEQFSDDSPKSNPWRDDALGYAAFSGRLAEALVAHEAPNGYVFGLHGEWGAGKSTVLNFVKGYLEKWREESRADIAELQWFDFEPWIVSGHQDLAAAYFKVLSEKLGGKAEKRGRLRRFTRGAIDAGADKLVDAAAKVGWVIDQTGGTASAAGAALTKAAVKKAAEKWLAEPSLQKSYGQLVERLRASGRRFIVFVDDIDRLTSEEIRSLMQMVKTVGRLPNVTYVLSYDRQIIWTALRDLAPADGKRSGYAEKIVQHELEVPVPSRSGLMRMLERSLPDMPPVPTAGIRWLEMIQTGLHKWIRHPRDVVRLSNAMHFAWAALKDEIDAYDVLCLEAMRLFDRKVFDWVRDNRELLLGEGLRYLSPNEEAAAAEAAELAKFLSEDARADIIPVLRILFPNRVNLFGNRRGYSTETWDSVVARRGIATKPGFNAYFSLAPSPFAIPKGLVDAASTPGVERAQHRDFIDIALDLKDENGGSLVGEYFQELIHRSSNLSRPDLSEMLKAVVDRSTAVFRANGEAGIFGPSSAHHVLIGQIYERLGADTSTNILDGIFAESEDVGALAALYVDLGRSLGVIATDGGTIRRFIPPEKLPSLGAALLPKIEAAFEAGLLTDLPHYYDVARAWAHLGGVEQARAWLADEARRNGHTLAKLSQGLLGTSVSGGRTVYGVFRSPEVDIYDIESIAEGCGSFADAPDLNDTERARIKALCGGLDVLRRKAATE